MIKPKVLKSKTASLVYNSIEVSKPMNTVADTIKSDTSAFKNSSIEIEENFDREKNFNFTPDSIRYETITNINVFSKKGDFYKLWTVYEQVSVFLLTLKFC